MWACVKEKTKSIHTWLLLLTYFHSHLPTYLCMKFTGTHFALVVCPHTFSHTVMRKVCLTVSNTVWTRWYGKIIEFYRISGERGFWFSLSFYFTTHTYIFHQKNLLSFCIIIIKKTDKKNFSFSPSFALLRKNVLCLFIFLFCCKFFCLRLHILVLTNIFLREKFTKNKLSLKYSS